MDLKKPTGDPSVAKVEEKFRGLDLSSPQGMPSSPLMKSSPAAASLHKKRGSMTKGDTSRIALTLKGMKTEDRNKDTKRLGVFKKLASSASVKKGLKSKKHSLSQVASDGRIRNTTK